jgi:hypothetical protein
MIISKTYQIITDESREHGDFADGDFEYENAEMSVDDLIFEMGNMPDISDYPFSLKALKSGAWFSSDPEMDIHSGDETIYSWHIDQASDLEFQKLFILLVRGGAK